MTPIDPRLARRLAGAALVLAAVACQVSPTPHPVGSVPARAGPTSAVQQRGSAPVSANDRHDPIYEGDCPRDRRCDYAALARTPPPKITEVLIHKGARRMHLVADETVVQSYRIALGYGEPGPKRYEGDGRTPVGTYEISSRLPTSPWHIFLGVSYPNLDDWRNYRELKGRGKMPWDAGIGFGIGIHGRSQGQRDGEHKRNDWTAGCIALDNHEIEQVAALVVDGTRVVITD